MTLRIMKGIPGDSLTRFTNVMQLAGENLDDEDYGMLSDDIDSEEDAVDASTEEAELMTSIGKPTPHLAVFDPGIPIYNWRGNERGIMQLFLLPGQFSLHRKLWA
jgi:hypothetical protein